MVYNSPVRRVVYDNAQSATEPHTTRGWGAVLMSWFSKSFVTAVVACGLAAAAASPAVAQGLINGDFSSSLSNWDVAPDGSLANTGSSLTVTNDFLTSGPDTTTIWSNTKSGTFAYVWSGQDGEYTTLSQKFSAVAGSVVSAYVAFATTDWYGDASYNDDAYLTLSKAGSATPVRSWTASVQNFYDFEYRGSFRVYDGLDELRGVRRVQRRLRADARRAECRRFRIAEQLRTP